VVLGTGIGDGDGHSDREIENFNFLCNVVIFCKSDLFINYFDSLSFKYVVGLVCFDEGTVMLCCPFFFNSNDHEKALMLQAYDLEK
jgi:hypothetical protein